MSRFNQSATLWSASALLLFTLVACGGGGSGGGAETGDIDTRVSLPVPLRAGSLPATGSLSAVLRVDGGAPVMLPISSDIASGSVSGLPTGNHALDIQISFIHASFGASVVTSASKNIDIVAGSNTVDFLDTEFDLTLDNDSDGVTNIDELAANTNPQALPTWGDTLWGQHTWRSN